MATTQENSNEPTVILFANKKSGGQVGPLVLDSYKAMLGEDKVYNLGEHNPVEVLRGWVGRGGVKRVIVCGGDGTMGWILAALDEVSCPRGEFLVAMMPLGTGNDLARSYNWGAGFNKSMVKQGFLKRVQKGKMADLDRWQISCIPRQNPGEEDKLGLPYGLSKRDLAPSATGGSSNNVEVVVEGEGETKDNDYAVADMPESIHPVMTMHEDLVRLHGGPKDKWVSFDGVFCNYFSLGVDAAAAHAFHSARERNPKAFNSQAKNKIMYVRHGTPAAGGALCCGQAPPPRINQYIEIETRQPGGSWTKVDIPGRMRGLILLNLQSYGGGRNLWGTQRSKRFQKPGVGDGMFEVVGVADITRLGVIMGFSKVGAKAKRVCQAPEIRMTTNETVFMQIDGEPWHQPPCTVHVKLFKTSPVLQG